MWVMTSIGEMSPARMQILQQTWLVSFLYADYGTLQPPNDAQGRSTTHQTWCSHLWCSPPCSCSEQDMEVEQAYPFSPLRMPLTTSLVPRLVCLRFEAFFASLSTFLVIFSSARGSAIGIKKGPVFFTTSFGIPSCNDIASA